MSMRLFRGIIPFRTSLLILTLMARWPGVLGQAALENRADRLEWFQDSVNTALVDQDPSLGWDQYFAPGDPIISNLLLSIHAVASHSVDSRVCPFTGMFFRKRAGCALETQ